MRTFILFLALTAGLLPAVFSGEENTPPTIQNILDRIQAKFGKDWSKSTVDTVKAGDPSKPVTGITMTMFPTLEILKQSAAEKRNLIICHEPCFYNHLDQLAPLEKDEIQQAKLKFIQDNGLVVFRFHDHSHRLKPDGILEGMVEALKWKEYQGKDEPKTFTLPATTLGALAKDAKEKTKASAVRIVGDKNMACSKIALSPGAAGYLTHILLLQRDDVEVLVVGEAREWETVEYARDAQAAGKKKALIILGHNVSEEEGMNYCTRWLADFVKEVPVKFVRSGDPFVAE
jgi:putative NIF3 family GTP cyclohydrolase 1 type 2